MGTFEWPVRIAGTNSERSETIEATVDTGAFDSMARRACCRTSASSAPTDAGCGWPTEGS